MFKFEVETFVRLTGTGLSSPSKVYIWADTEADARQAAVEHTQDRTDLGAQVTAGAAVNLGANAQ